MRLPRKKNKVEETSTSPEDTQEMFTAGQSLPEDSDETREYETVAVSRKGETVDGKTEESTELDLEPEEPESEDGDETRVMSEDEEIVEGEDLDAAEATVEFEDEETVEAIQEEAWEGDEYEEWEEEDGGDPDEEFDDDLEDEPEDEEVPDEGNDPDAKSGTDAEAKEERDVLAELKVWFSEFRTRAGVLWARLLKRVGETKVPRHEIDGQKVLAAAGIAAVALLIAAGGYLLGKGSGDDLDTARLEGEFAGRKAGAVAGATKGYAVGFKKGRDLAFRKSYSASYKRNYIRAYESAGMDPPKPENIQVPEP